MSNLVIPDKNDLKARLRKKAGLVPLARYCRAILEKATEEPPGTDISAAKEGQRDKRE